MATRIDSPLINAVHVEEVVEAASAATTSILEQRIANALEKGIVKNQLDIGSTDTKGVSVFLDPDGKKLYVAVFSGNPEK